MPMREQGTVHPSRVAASMLFVATLTLATLATPVARADDPLPPPAPDNDPHTFCFGAGVGGDARENMRAAEWNALDPTQATVLHDDTCELTGSTETDVVWRVEDLPDDVLGANRCEDVDDTRCDQYYSRLDMAQIAVGNYDEVEETMVACHELGHTVRLPHGPRKRDCMITEHGYDPPLALRYRRYSDHHIYSHINIMF
jgi:hypothetical protein